MLNRNGLNEVAELDLTGHLGDHRVHVRIPVGQCLTRFYLGPIGNQEFRSVRNLVTLFFTTGTVIDNANFTRT